MKPGDYVLHAMFGVAHVICLRGGKADVVFKKGVSAIGANALAQLSPDIQ